MTQEELKQILVYGSYEITANARETCEKLLLKENAEKLTVENIIELRKLQLLEEIIQKLDNIEEKIN